MIPSRLGFFLKQLLHSKTAMLAVTLLTLAAAILNGYAPLLIGRMIEKVTAQQEAGLLPLALLILAAFIAAELCNAIRGYISSRAMLRVTYELTENMLRSILRTSADFFTRTPRGELLQRCVQDTRIVQQFGLHTIPALAHDLLLAGIAVAVISGMHGAIAITLGVSYALLFVPVHIFGGKRKEARTKLVRHNAFLRQSLLEKLESMKQIHIFGTRRRENERFREEQAKWADLSYRNVWMDGMYKLFPRIPDSLAPTVVLLYAGWSVIQGDMTVGQLATILAYIPALNAPVRSLFAIYATIGDIRARIDGILEYLQLPREPGATGARLQLPHYRSTSLSFVDVTVKGDNGSYLLRDISFTVSPGEHIAVVGPSGAGKSTLLKLIARLLEPTNGEIRLGERLLSDIDAVHWRSRIGYLVQEGFLFHDTLRRNLTYFNEADEETLDRWMQAFGAGDIVWMRPQGYDTVIGDVLSGGQRQLVSLVRTMIRQPDLLLLDEATGSLDQASETLVYQALDKHASSLLRISVTHRLHNAVHADRILVLAHGRLVQQGTHEELLRRTDGLYARLWYGEQQTRGDTLAEAIRS